MCHYRLKSSGSDELSKSIIQFKNRNDHHVNAWIDCAVQEFKKELIKEDVVIIRALGHQEIQTDSPESPRSGLQLAPCRLEMLTNKYR
jgi:hypothetical protein